MNSSPSGSPDDALRGALRVAISPCPNDSFIFAAWILGLVPGLAQAPARFFWADVEELNQAAEARRFDVVKLSAAAALGLTETYEILPSGAAFGLGAGPKLVARPEAPRHPKVVAVPGLRTTALAVLRAAMDEPFEARPMLFSDIAAAVQTGQADAGLLIHETALAPERYGLEIRLDLGAWWAAETRGAPLPLGVIAARRDLPEEVRAQAARTIRASMEQARKDPDSIGPLVRILAQELDDGLLAAHIEAYVNDLSLDMGPRGREALKYLEAMARRK